MQYLHGLSYWQIHLLKYAKYHYGVPNFGYNYLRHFYTRMYDVDIPDIPMDGIDNMVFDLHEIICPSRTPKELYQLAIKERELEGDSGTTLLGGPQFVKAMLRDMQNTKTYGCGIIEYTNHKDLEKDLYQEWKN